MTRKHQPKAGPAATGRPAPAQQQEDESGDAASKRKKPDDVCDRERKVDETIEESFPSSDPPSWTLGKSG